MSKLFKILAVILLASVVVVVLFKPEKKEVKLEPTITPSSTSIPVVTKTASFKIITNGTTRIFTDKKYHNQSLDVYITAQSPELIYIKKDGVKWSDFFATLPMKLTKECLTTGTSQVFCTNSQNSLKFYINQKENSNALDKVINDGDILIVEYK